MLSLRPGQKNRFWGLTGLLLAGFILLWGAAAGAGAGAGEKSSKKVEPAELQKILAAFEKYAEQARQAWQVPGMAIAVVQEDKIVYAKGFGVKELGKAEPVQEETLFQIGSTSKAFTAALMGMLVDENKFGWQDKVVELLADFQMADPWVTREFLVEDVMAQRSGLPGHAGDLQSILGFDRQHIIRTLRYLKPMSSFRSQFAYQNGLFLVAGALIEKSSGKGWEENIRERIFFPLGMSASSTSFQALREAKNRATGHVWNQKGQVEMLPWDWPFHQAPYIHGPAGGINSNILDMGKWLRLQLAQGKFGDQRLLSETNLEFLRTPKTAAGSKWGLRHFYCEAWIYTPLCPHPLVWHNGGTQGYKTMVALVPEAGMGLVVLSNLVTDLPEALALAFYDFYFHRPDRDWSGKLLQEFQEARKKEKLPRRPPSPAPPLPLKNYAGTYAHPVYGNLVVTADRASLAGSLGPKQVKMSFRPWDRDNFFYVLPEVDQGKDPGGASFGIGADGRAHGLVLDVDGGTEFKRVGEKSPSQNK
ncbi:MAG: serine hydrolase [Thermodesulfobacteriota bacterium]